MNSSFSGDAAGEGGGSCAPAGATSTDDAGGGCHPGPITANGGDVCTSSQYGVACYGVTQPLDSLQCQQLAWPTPQGVDFFCCPCVPATCGQSVAVGCSSGPLGQQTTTCIGGPPGFMLPSCGVPIWSCPSAPGIDDAGAE